MNPEPATGIIVGGWDYVIAAYAVTWLFLVGYAWSIRSRMLELT